MSEDPYLAGELASEYTLGVQSHGVGVSVKHFAANNQEYDRMSTDTVISKRALMEIEPVVKGFPRRKQGAFRRRAETRKKKDGEECPRRPN